MFDLHYRLSCLGIIFGILVFQSTEIFWILPFGTIGLIVLFISLIVAFIPEIKEAWKIFFDKPYSRLNISQSKRKPQQMLLHDKYLVYLQIVGLFAISLILSDSYFQK